MDNLWAPWRREYIYLKKRRGCIFCKRDMQKGAKRSLAIDASRHSFSMLNLYPYNNGHVMVAPFRHVKGPEGLSDEELFDLIKMVKKMKLLLDRRLKPHGYNIGMNIGKVSGAGYDGHLHIHIVPRWTGDTNFMPVIADTKVVPESLEAMLKLLRPK